MKTTVLTLGVGIVIAGLGQTAHADNKRKKAEEAKLEASFAFLGGQRSYDGATFSYANGSGNQVLSGPFRSPTLAGMPVTGYGFDLRYINNGVRFSVGWDRPYAQMRDRQMSVTLGSGQIAAVRSIKTREFRLSIGVERAFGKLTAHADLVGSADVVDADVVADGVQATYQSKNFNFAARGGLTTLIGDEFYAHVSGELGLHGNIDWSVNAGVGLRL